MKVVVTQEHINKDMKMAAGLCPIALAAKDAGLKRVSVGPAEIYILKRKLLRSYFVNITLPEEVQYFISRFDGGLKVKPFEFELEIA